MKRRIRRGDVVFEFDDRDFDEIRRGRDLAAAVEAAANRMASRARSTAPGDSGEYRDSIRVETGQTRSRARARVVADAPHATVVESRTSNLKRAIGG